MSSPQPPPGRASPSLRFPPPPKLWRASAPEERRGWRVWRRSTRAILFIVSLAALAGALGVTAAANAPIIIEPARDGQVVSFFDVHMVTAPFSPSVAEETHVCSDWQIDSLALMEVVWQATCASGPSSVHVHLGDGEFQGSHAGSHQLLPDVDYRLRVRFQVRSPDGQTESSAWAERAFHTSKAPEMQPLLLSDVARIPLPSWSDESGTPIVLPDASVALRLEAQGVGLVLELRGQDGARNQVVNPEGLLGHGPLRVVLVSQRTTPTVFPSSRIHFADGEVTTGRFACRRSTCLPALPSPSGSARMAAPSSEMPPRTRRRPLRVL